MRTLPLTLATASLAQFVVGLDDDAVVVTARGRPIAALIPLANVDRETISLSTSPSFLNLIRRSRVSRKRAGGLSSAEVRARLGLKRVRSRKK